MGKRMDMNKRANILCKDYAMKHDETRCCVCGTPNFLTFMHRQKRRNYQTAEELSNPKEWVVACLKCHVRLEFDRKATEELFKRLRG